MAHFEKQDGRHGHFFSTFSKDFCWPSRAKGIIGRDPKFAGYRDASRARDTRYLASFSTSPQFGIFGAFGRRRNPACLQNGGAPITSRESFDFIIMKAIFGRFFGEKCYFI